MDLFPTGHPCRALNAAAYISSRLSAMMTKDGMCCAVL